MRLLASVRSQWIGSLALFLVLAGGTAWATNEWTGQNILNESLTGVDIKNDTVQGPDVPEPAPYNAGVVWAGQPTTSENAAEFFYLDGVSFRCEPSGRNGCP